MFLICGQKHAVHYLNYLFLCQRLPLELLQLLIYFFSHIKILFCLSDHHNFHLLCFFNEVAQKIFHFFVFFWVDQLRKVIKDDQKWLVAVCLLSEFINDILLFWILFPVKLHLFENLSQDLLNWDEAVDVNSDGTIFEIVFVISFSSILDSPHNRVHTDAVVAKDLENTMMLLQQELNNLNFFLLSPAVIQ